MSWQARKLGEFISIKHGWAFKGEYFSDAGKYILLTPGNAHETGGLKLRPGKEKFYSGDFPPDYLMKSGDMLVVMTDLIQAAPILGGAIVVPEDDRFLHNQRLGLVEFISETPIDKDFLYYLLNSPDYRAQVRGSATGATVRHTAPRRMCDCNVLVPDTLAEQRKVAQVLSAYDDLIATNQRRIALLEDAARRLYREWFVHLCFPGHESVPVKDGVPEGWQAGLLGSLMKTSSGGTPSRKRADFFGSGIPWVKTKELNDGFLFETEEEITLAGLESSSAKIFPAGTVLLAMYGATIGMTALLAKPAATNQACCAFLVAETKGLSYYCFQWLKEIKQKLISLGMGAAQPNLSQEVIKKLEFLLPSAQVLDGYHEAVSPIFVQMATLFRQNRTLAQTRDLLLPKLMSGQLDVSGIRLPEEIAA
ncbi:MAG: restriction endonuclease subunit S [Candidatus Kapabacteria bacterium]|nr:restriction endonuclease subunit S [Candidatus Kapabacteria bacterium]